MASSSSSVNNEKHPKHIVIDYYDSLISEVDIFAEELLKNVKGTDHIQESHSQDDGDDLNDSNSSNSFYEQIEKKFEPKSSVKAYKFDDHVVQTTGELVKDFIHSQRIKTIEMIKELQKERLEEINALILAKNKPTTTQEALFGQKFCFIIQIDKTRINQAAKSLLTVFVDFYLENNEVQLLEYNYLYFMIN